MTEQERGKYASKHPAGTDLDQDVAHEIRLEIVDGQLSCAAATRIAETLDIKLAEVGQAADLMDVAIDQCILGLFGFEKTDGQKRRVTPADRVTRDVEKAIRCRLTDGRLTCQTCWEIAASLGESRYRVSQAAEALKIKISKCQIGAF